MSDANNNDDAVSRGRDSEDSTVYYSAASTEEVVREQVNYEGRGDNQRHEYRRPSRRTVDDPELDCNCTDCLLAVCGVVFFGLLFCAYLMFFPIGIWMVVRANRSASAITTNDGSRSGYFLHSYRSGYICGAEPPTQEELVTRNAVPMCLNLTINAENRTRYGDYVSNRPLCLQAGALDQPAVWCTAEAELRDSLFLWWSPCDKCGTAWRIFDEQDNDKSFFKRPTFPQPKSSAVPLEDGWLEWKVENKSWENATSVSISECYSGDGGYSYGAEDSNSTMTNFTYTIPPACYSDTIYTGRNPIAVTGLTLLVIGCCCWISICGAFGKYLYFIVFQKKQTFSFLKS